MAAYYNEFEPFAAAWLRELIKAGHIAPGDVDERSIEDVRPDDLKRYTQCHFFAGIGVWSRALRSAGWPDDRPVWTGSCPCQPFSSAGKGKGTADKRHLWPSWFHLIEQHRPDNIFGEQVEAAIRHGWLDLVQTDLENLGYAFGAVDTCAAGFGAPHIRQRIYFTAQRLADSRGSQPRGLPSGEGQEVAEAGRGGAAGVLADPVRVGDRDAGLREGGSGQEGAGQEVRLRPSPDPCDGGSGCLVADASGVRREQQRGAEGASIQGVCAERGGEHAEPGHAGELSGGPEGLRGSGGVGVTDSEREEAERGVPDGPPTECLGGFWAGADWLPCRDGKWRPVEPGTFPLAHGAAARVGRLRGYGNAIVAPQAENFVKAFLEAEAGR